MSGAQRGKVLGSEGSKAAARGDVVRAERLSGRRVPLEGEEGSARASIFLLVSRG